MNLRINQIFLICLVVLIIACDRKTEKLATKYTIENGAITGYNTGLYNNRPLYINNSNAFILAGDQPIARLAKGQFLYGTFMVAVEHQGKVRWLQDCQQIISRYRTGTIEWEVTDPSIPGIKITLRILPMANSTGMAVQVSAEGVSSGTKLIWAFGGSKWRKGENLSWKLDVMGQPELIKWGFVPDECADNRIEVQDNSFYISLPGNGENNNGLFTVAGKCSEESEISIGDASRWSNATELRNSEKTNLPLLTGKFKIMEGKPAYLTFEAFNYPAFPDSSRVVDPENAFSEGKKRTDSFEDRLKINTPDPWLNAIASASVAAVDGTWYPPVFMHGAMQWNSRFPGWRTVFGGTMYGWHERVMKEARFYTDSQVKASNKKEAKADPATLLTEQHSDSRFYGVGRLTKDQRFYDMQTQFFDQIIEEYRFTGDPELIKFFREALELHLNWMSECFDPDGDGVYESYINVWASDSQWYNGGGTAEETSYAYRGHTAARDMARNEGDKEAEKHHELMLEKIRQGFFDKLWISDKGHSGSYREQGGHERLHEDPWLYSIFLPVDAGLTSPLQSIESVYYSEWALQNDRMPSGGRRVWTSNWLPGIWSVRELWPADNYHLALAYFQAGLPEEGYDIMRGTFMHSAYDHLVPGNFGSIQGGTDFGDCLHTFTRSLVAGLFGYNPDYPNGVVRISPRFPSEWNNASLELPDMKIAFERNGDIYDYSVELARMADMVLLLPVYCEEVTSVRINGKIAKWELMPGAGRSIVKVDMEQIQKTEVRIETNGSLPYYSPVFIEGNAGDIVKLTSASQIMLSYEDPQGVLEEEVLNNNELSARLSDKKGYHTVFAMTKAGNAPQLRVFRIKINDPEGDAEYAARFEEKVPVNSDFINIDISSSFNADVTTIYKQHYISPRPNTVSLRLGSDGYSPWTFPHWKSLPPTIKTDKVTAMLNNENRLTTPQGVPFLWHNGANNIAFTSLWDNYPDKIVFPVNKSGNSVWFLVCGSTNIMQCQIANAVLKLKYADGLMDSLELIPPVNYWNLSTIDSHATAPGQGSRTDYTSETDRFCLPAKLPETVQLGENCRAMLLNLRLRKGVELESVTLETLSQEVVVGLMGISVSR